MRKRFLTTLNLLGTPLLVAACAIAGSTGADRMRRAFIVLFLIASIGCSGESPVAPSPVAETRYHAQQRGCCLGTHRERCHVHQRGYRLGCSSATGNP